MLQVRFYALDPLDVVFLKRLHLLAFYLLDGL